MSLLIAEHISRTLTENEGIAQHIGRRCYPTMITSSEVPAPYIVHNINSVKVAESTKDGDLCDSTDVSILVCAKTYDAAIEIAQRVRYALVDKSKEYSAFEVLECRLNSISVEYSLEVECYVVTLYMTFEDRDKIYY